MMNKKTDLSCLLKLLILIIGFQFMAQQANGQEEKFKALFVYNFTKYIEWPSDMGGENFNIAVYGNRDLFAQLTDVSNKMKVGSKRIIVTLYTTVEDIPTCQIAYFGASKTEEIPVYAKKIKGNKVLIIGDKEKSCPKGACINFIKKNGNLNYEISKSSMESGNIKYSSNLAVLGTLIE